MMIRSICAMATAILLIACKEKRQSSSREAPAPAAAEAAAAPAPAYAVPDTFRAALEKVLEGYVRIQSALAEDDLAAAKEALGGMHAVLHMMPEDGLDTAAKAYWDASEAEIMEALHPMSGTESIDSARSHFMGFSRSLIDVIDKLGVSGNGPIHQFHCPMADNNRGADWLQRGRDLRNPYFGKSMLKCGSLVRTLKG